MHLTCDHIEFQNITLIPHLLKFLDVKLLKLSECLESMRPFCRPNGSMEYIKEKKHHMEIYKEKLVELIEEKNVKEIAVL